MSPLHNRFTDEQVAFLFQAYKQGPIKREEIQEALDIHHSRFFVFLKKSRMDPDAFTISYERRTSESISSEAEAAIKRGLLERKFLSITQPN